MRKRPKLLRADLIKKKAGKDRPKRVIRSEEKTQVEERTLAEIK